jgi:dinuclear metal center YbgI/SA1388 family protein
MMLVADLEAVLEKLAPKALAEPGDNSGLLVGDARAPVRRVLVALELTEPVLGEAIAGGYDTILTHHPLLFSPLRSLVDSRPRERLVRRLIAAQINLVACHTNLDAAPEGLADIAGEALGLQGMAPLQRACAGWYKLVGFVPAEALETVAAAVFADGAGAIGGYRECAFAAEGRGWFTPGPDAHPVVGRVAQPERTPEIRWETVVPRARVSVAIAAYIDAHPYEEPAFDIYPVENVLVHAGLGRVGTLVEPLTVSALAARAEEMFGLGALSWSGDGRRVVHWVGVVPGSGRSLIDQAAAVCEVLITGDLGYHDAERAGEAGLSLIALPHGDFEWWAFRRWSERLGRELVESEVTVATSREWRSPWTEGDPYVPPAALAAPRAPVEVAAGGARGESAKVRVWIDGGSRGNPGRSAIGVVLEDGEGSLLDTVGRVIGTATNNVAEYRALLTGLEMAERVGAREVEVLSDSELLVKQMRGEYRVKNEGLKLLHSEAERRAHGFSRFSIRHVKREQNSRADGLVNRALDEGVSS